MQEVEQLTELQCDRTLKIKFNEISLDVFWISVRKVHPVTSAKTAKIVLQFSISYLREQAFSRLTNITGKKENIHFLSRKNCECVCQKFDQGFNIYAKRNKLKYHIKSKLYNGFGYQLYFEVLSVTLF
jgi:hypothetical protein